MNRRFSTNDDPLGGALGEVRDAVHQAAQGVLDRFDRRYWLDCARNQRFTDEMWQAMADQGLLGLGVPEAHGGSGGGITEIAAAMEALAAGGVPIALFLLTAFAREAILRHGHDEQCKRFVTPTVSGQDRMCFAITEPNAGTNSFAMETTATKTVDGTYLLNGQKIFISGVDAANRMMVVARTARLTEVADRRQGLSLFVVDIPSRGLTYQPIDIGIVMPDRQFTVFFDDLELEADRLIGDEGEGFHYLFDALNPERLLVAAWAVGLGDYVLAKAVAYARERAPFGKPIGSYQALQHPLAEGKARLDAARLMMFTACRIFDGGGNAGYLSNAAKLLASQAAVDVCDHAIQTHGGYAFNQEYDVSTIWPVVRLLKIAPVNNEMILNYIGEHVLRLPRSY
ncbi:MAG TPA: acyl-CoA dehydrogenase family protein [Acidimicrobiales bacterium]|nr:acyl-CoA dehydrogenase family protein [Acidimicrobiales bacterium]